MADRLSALEALRRRVEELEGFASPDHQTRLEWRGMISRLADRVLKTDGATPEMLELVRRANGYLEWFNVRPGSGNPVRLIPVPGHDVTPRTGPDAGWVTGSVSTLLARLGWARSNGRAKLERLRDDGAIEAVELREDRTHPRWTVRVVDRSRAFGRRSRDWPGEPPG
jgi:hypothetical protein